ncbi:MAG: geranylgeranylglycerol-phosphate geranylgeranyltransferase [Cyclobacteriaceae bacterium]|nr:geranylgeranylglycerol-phosphate geranylgeranyltransferase [Cyclobacteriaceae bacterium]UYN86562.1 MAG: geranylgeranylglycerol-phosphate geranylgeranyltransferase [Cyclobacteriaceae bacterium]
MRISKRIIVALLRLTRTWNLLILVFAQYFTAWFLLKANVFTDWRLLLLTVSSALIAAGGYVINDYYDVKIDLVNNPNRVVVGRSVPRRFAILLHGLLSAAGIALGVFLSWWMVAINIFSVSLLWFYSNLLKRLPFVGNLAVALLTGISIAVLNVLYFQNNLLVIIYALFAFFVTLIREVIKDMEDLKGDNTYGCKTLPIVWGIRKTKNFIYGMVAVLGAAVLFINQVYVKLPLIYFIMMLFVPLAWLVMQLIKADTKRDFSWLSSFCKVIMLLGILSMALV